MSSRPLFLGWRDLVITPLVQAFTLVVTVGVLAFFRARYHLSWTEVAALYYPLLVAVTLVVLRLWRWRFPMRPGVYSYEKNPRECHAWNVHGFLCATNLSPLYINALLPAVPSLVFPFSRKLLCSLLGAKFGKGIIVVGGRVIDPWLVSVGDNAVIGDDCLLLPHLVTRGETSMLVLNRITIEADVIIGARTTILPGVVVGRGATINAMSVIPMNTRIGEGEVWGGNPARRLGSRIPQAA